jgi:hypothetical protein
VQEAAGAGDDDRQVHDARAGLSLQRAARRKCLQGWSVDRIAGVGHSRAVHEKGRRKVGLFEAARG